MIRACGSANRFPLAPAASTSARTLSFSLALRAIGPPLGAVGGGRRYGLFMDFRIAVQELERHTLAQPMPQPLQVAALLHHTPDRRRWALAGAGDLFHLGVEVRGGGGDALALGDGFQEQRAADGPLGAGAQLGQQLGIVPLDATGIDALPPQALARVLDLMADLAHDQRVRYRELVAGQERVDDLVFQRVAVLPGPPRLQLLEDLRPQRLQRLELAP